MNGAIPVTDQPIKPAVPPAPETMWGGTFMPPASSPRSPVRIRRGFRQTVRWYVRYPFTREGRRQGRYAALSLLLAIPGFVFVVVALVVGFGLSLGVAGMLLGVPLLMAALLGARRFGEISRHLASRYLGVEVEPPPPLRPQRPGLLGRVQACLTDPVGWRACGYMLIKFPLALVTVLVGSYLLIYGVPYVLFPIWWEILHVLAAHGVLIQVPGWLGWWGADPVLVAHEISSLPLTFLFIPVGASVFFWAPLAVKGGNSADAKLVVRLLGPPPSHRVRELEQSRARAVDDSAARLRRIERDLHDGAQAQMVAVAMKLGLAREKLGARDEALPGGITEADLERALQLVDAAHRSAKEAITELRDLARGIHPPVLDHGLGTALTTLAARSDVPVELVVDVPERPSAAIETIAYFCAAELLTNVAKHSGARHATLEAVHVPGLLRVRVSDDGHGGARLEARGGLAGLAERVRTVDGKLQVSSPPHGPTTVTVELPSHA
jgi:signal transduction histidine kinase